MKLGTGLIILLFLTNPVSFAQPKTLDYYLLQASANSPLLRDYKNQILSTRYDSLLINANYKPQINAVSTNIYAPIINGMGYDAAVTNGGTYSALMTVNKTLVGRYNLETQRRTVGIQAEIIDNISKISQQDLRKAVAMQYITVYGDQQLLLNNIKINELLQQQEIILKRLTEKNIYKQTDYLTFLVTYKQQALQLRQLKIQFQSDFANLNYLCGLFDTSASQVILTKPGIEVQSLPSEQVSIFFYKYILDSLRLKNDITLNNLLYRPKLNVFGDGGFSSSQFQTVYKNLGLSVGFSINLPIFDGNKRRINLSKIKLSEDTRLGYKDFFKTQYDQQIAELKQQLQSIDELTNDINAQIEYTQGLIQVHGKLLETGDVKISDFIIAINNYLNAQYLITQNSINRLQIINQINYWNR